MDIYMRGNVNTLHNIRDMSLLIYYLVNRCYKCLSLQLKSFKCFTELHLCQIVLMLSWKVPLCC